MSSTITQFQSPTKISYMWPIQKLTTIIVFLYDQKYVCYTKTKVYPLTCVLYNQKHLWYISIMAMNKTFTQKML